MDNGSECQNEDTALKAKLKKMMVLNAKLKTWLWTPKTDETECLKLEEIALIAYTEDMALNAKLNERVGFECLNWNRWL